MRHLSTRGRLAAAAFAVLLAARAEAAPAPDVLGVSHAAGLYNFTSEDYLNEGADRVLALGSRVLKVFVIPTLIAAQYPFNSDWSPPTSDVAELLQRPYFQSLFAKPFTTFVLVVGPVTGAPQFLDGLSSAEAAAEHDQMYRITQYLLTAYAGSGKTFVLQNWEGDHLLYSGLGDTGRPDAVRVQGMIDWWNVRQQGVRDARRDVGEQAVTVLHACEVNFLADAMAGKVTATNDVLPATSCDLYSYSSWDLDFTPAALVQALDYLASKAPPSFRFGNRNIYLGEYGLPKTVGFPEGQRYERIRELMEAALGWGARYAIYWQVFANEAMRAFHGRPTNKDLTGLWLVRPDGVLTPAWSNLSAQLGSTLHRATLRSVAGLEVTVNADRGMGLAPPNHSNPWQVLLLKDQTGGELESGHTVSLQAHDGLYASVNGGRGGRVVAGASATTSSELFTVRKAAGTGRTILPGEGITLQSQKSGRYLGTDAGGRGLLRAVRTVPTATEVFTFLDQGD